jgi:hypothetical protein
MDEYSTDDLLEVIVTGLDPRVYDPYDQTRAEAERILAEHDRVVAANAWENCAQEAWESELLGHKKRDRLMAKNPYRITEENN